MRWSWIVLSAACGATPVIDGGLDAAMVDAAVDAARNDAPPALDAITSTDAAPGAEIGDFYLTYYWFLLESDYSGGDDTDLRDSSCNIIARVPQAFADEVCVEGSGRLTEGVVINYSSDCACGHPCSSGPTVCFAVLDATTYPWGSGSTDNALEPLRSWAVDESVIAHSSVLYAPDWDGVAIPSVDGLGGFVHDGCFRADDTGNGITGNHIDFFAGTTMMWNRLEAMFPSIDRHFTVYQGGARCAYLAR